MTQTAPIWSPSETRRSNSNMFAFMNYLEKEKNLPFNSYEELYNWSVTQIPDFWQALWEFTSVIASRTTNSVLEGTSIQRAVWFRNAKLNFAENLLRHRTNQPALVYCPEGASPERLTYNELHHKVAAFANGLRNAGVQKGDRVAAFISNRPEAIIGMLATASIGAIWSSCSPDFGYQGVLDRFGQIKPKVLIAVDGYQYNGKSFDTTKTIERILHTIPEICQTVIISSGIKVKNPDIAACITWEEFSIDSSQPLIFEQLPFDHPLYIMYSSGTTGKPKCIVHGAGGTLLQHLKELSLHTDLKQGDIITYFTTCGWMMWNWLISSLAIGATIVLYDGSPSFPDLGALYRVIESEKINIFGTSPKFLSACESKGLIPREQFNLGSLRTILSTGAPLSIKNFEYVYKDIKKDLQLASISGGTDIVSCFMLGNPILPVYKGELQCRGLGMKVETFNDKKQSVLNEIGELVCTAPFPSRPVAFWNDEKGEQYKDAYFSHYEGIWRHGDYILINSHGGCVIYGRSDATLNPGGVRIGTAEIYGPVEAMNEIEDAIVVGKRVENDTHVVLFVVLAPGVCLTDQLKDKIRQKLKTDRTPRHVPSEIHQVDEIPRTLSGKKVELAVTKLLHGEPISNRDAIANPDALEQFVKYT